MKRNNEPTKRTDDMTLNEATLLRDKFYEGSSTPAEERRLAAFLDCEACPAEWAEEARVLLALLPTEADELPAGFGLRLHERLRQEAQAERAAGGTRRKTAKRIRLAASWTGAAAAAVAAVCLLWFPSAPDGTSADPVAQAGDHAEAPAPVSAPASAPHAKSAAPIYNNGVAGDASERATAAEARSLAAAPAPKSRTARRKAASPEEAEIRTAVATPEVPAAPPTDVAARHDEAPMDTPDPYAETMARTRATIQTMQAECMAYLAEDFSTHHIQP